MISISLVSSSLRSIKSPKSRRLNNSMSDTANSSKFRKEDLQEKDFLNGGGGAQWILLPSRRMGKLVSSMVFFLRQPVEMLVSEQTIRMRGKKHQVDEYEFARGRR